MKRGPWSKGQLVPAIIAWTLAGGSMLVGVLLYFTVMLTAGLAPSRPSHRELLAEYWAVPASLVLGLAVVLLIAFRQIAAALIAAATSAATMAAFFWLNPL